MFSLDKGVSPDIEELEDSLIELEDNVDEFTVDFETTFSDSDFEALLEKI